MNYITYREQELKLLEVGQERKSPFDHPRTDSRQLNSLKFCLEIPKIEKGYVYL